MPWTAPPRNPWVFCDKREKKNLERSVKILAIRAESSVWLNRIIEIQLEDWYCSCHRGRYSSVWGTLRVCLTFLITCLKKHPIKFRRFGRRGSVIGSSCARLGNNSSMVQRFFARVNKQHHPHEEIVIQYPFLDPFTYSCMHCTCSHEVATLHAFQYRSHNCDRKFFILLDK